MQNAQGGTSVKTSRHTATQVMYCTCNANCMRTDPTHSSTYTLFHPDIYLIYLKPLASSPSTLSKCICEARHRASTKQRFAALQFLQQVSKGAILTRHMPNPIHAWKPIMKQWETGTLSMSIRSLSVHHMSVTLLLCDCPIGA